MEDRTKKQLIEEIALLRKQVAGLERGKTERKRAEETLRQERDRAQKYLDVAEVMFVAIHVKGEVALINQKGGEILGYEQEEIIGKNWFDNFVTEGMRDEVKSVFQKLVAGQIEPVEYFENPVLTKSGKERMLAWHNTVLRDEAGNIIGTLSSGEDITERKRAEGNLKERVKELNCLYAIAQIAESPGLTSDELYQGVANLLPASWQYPEITSARIVIDGKVLETANYRDSQWRQTSDVQVYGTKAGTVEVNYLEEKPQIDEGPFLKEERLLIDAVAERLGRITERKQAEEELRKHREHLEELVQERTAELRKAQERLSGIYDSSKDAIGYANLEGVLLDVNDSFSKLTGYSKEELLAGKKYQDLTPKEYQEYEANIIGEILRTGQPAEYEKEYVRKDGSRVPILLTTFLVREVDGKPIGVAAILKDVTERKRAAATLRESEQKYRTLTETINDIVFTIDREGGFTYLSPRFDELTGYLQEDLIGHSFTEVLAPEYRESTVDRFRRGLSGETIPLYEVELLFKDGKRLPVEFDVSPLLGAEGQTIGRLGVARDITERKRAEEALRESEEKLRGIFSTLADGITIVGLDGRNLDCNDAVLRLHGVSRNEYIGRSVYDFIAPEVLERGHLRSEVKALRKKQGIFDAEINISLLRDASGEPIAFLGATRDITQRKRAEEALRKAEQDWRSSFNSLEDVMLIIDKDYNIENINDNGLALLWQEQGGSDREEMLPSH